mmetsp:Transcript_13777/g.24128  ORF Transcript_13777/g.24128 Transcript_13777/m.24128 type:complete len:228 (+) Transcript_13777:104-787(+)|eukprot:CAMPEP_0119103752 /NCGR_PEP_ID=MMETSP1180-20130426/2128_1 /TAXON_ID=3052 ORGANISM="Chlamydomonas cf sp, Strain CCMP681" /NCGR_SAMPLE_ID=MMETSP1180 /ASSEMBLY_ACC=CAM_ASM_000741 /LENGTH=227 /DNA_ID=CAMNT_0007088331 /DNA_START=70 /DNA_END=753 /DNA_ORIENTATION=+
MSGPPVGPALPWGVPAEAEPEPEPQAEAAAEPDQLIPPAMNLEGVGLTSGGVVEVRWDVETEDGQESKVWWQAKVADPPAEVPAEQQSEAPQPQFELQYEARENMPAETCIVRFISSTLLYDCKAAGYLYWRKAGETWEPDSSSSEEEELEALSMEEQDARVAALTDELMDGLEPAQQAVMASSMRDFMDSANSFFVQHAGLGGVVDEDAVHKFLDDFKSKKRQREE